MIENRPKAGETEEDLLRLQAEFAQSQKKCSVQVNRVQRGAEKQPSRTADPPAASQPPQPPYAQRLGAERNFTEGGRFTLNLDTVAEEHFQRQVLFGVEERHADILTGTDPYLRFSTEMAAGYSKDDGFPEVLNLAPYYNKSGPRRQPIAGQSFFASEFDRIHGKIQESIYIPDDVASEEQPSTSEPFDAENQSRLAAMSQEEIKASLKEIEEKLDPKLIEFLRSRSKNKSASQREAKEEAKPKKSLFKQQRENCVPEAEAKSEPPIAPKLSDMVKQLEVLEEWREDENYHRLAADAVQLDLLSKCAQKVLPRQAQQATRLFDTLKPAPGSEKVDDPLLHMAQNELENIKELYLEEVRDGDKSVLQFANGLNPVIDGAWMLRPIRAVLDAMQAGERTATPEDVEIVRLALLWTLLLFSERPTLFHTMVDPNDLYVRLSETFLIGPEVFTDSVIDEILARLFTGFLLPLAEKGRLMLRLEKPVAGLDAFMPFYEELLTRFDDFSTGHVGFTKYLLLGSYGNNSLSDALQCQVAMWSSRRKIVRQATATATELAQIVNLVKTTRPFVADSCEDEFYVQYSMLLSEYAGALRSGAVTRDRNGGVFQLAATELGSFVTRHTNRSAADPKRVQEFDILVTAIREGVKEVLHF